MKKINDVIYKAFGVKPKTSDIWEEAFTHPSLSSTSHFNNQRLEFLGDSILGAIISKYVYKKFKENEGILSKYKAALVSKEACILYMEQLNLKNNIILSKGEKKNGINDSVLADAFEALLGALFLEFGFALSYDIFVEKFKKIMDEILRFPPENYKGILQDYAQKYKLPIEYVLMNTEGKEHCKTFMVKVIVGDLSSLGKGSSKKKAEQEAAKNFLKLI